MTYGTDLPAASSTFQRRHGIERKRQVAEYQVPKIIQEKKLLLYIEDDIWVPFSRAVSTFRRRHGNERKNKQPKIRGSEKIQEKKHLSFREDDMRDP